MTVPLPTKYPSQASSTSPPPPANRTIHETSVVPMRQEFHWLRQGVSYAYHNLTTNERNGDGKLIRWTKEAALAYLRTMAVNESVQEDVYKSAIAKRANPLGITARYIPALWETNIPMERFLNSPMHLLFHGLVSGVMELSHKFMKLLAKLATFERLVNIHLSKIESFRLAWIKLRELPNTKWLAENLLGMTRIMPAVYGLFFENFSVPNVYSEAAQSLQHTINALHVLISTLMSPSCTFTDSKKIDVYIKIFLSCVHKSARLILGVAEGDAWLTNKANPVSLLNLTRQIEQFGPMRWYYEAVCERYIQVVKPHLVKNMRRTPSYFQKKLVLLHKLVFMKWLSRQFEPNHNQADNDNQNHYKGYYRYQSIDLVKSDFDGCCPISCFKLDIGPQQLFWIAYGRPKEPTIIPLVASVCSAESRCGFYYFQFSLLDDKCAEQSKVELDQHISSHCLLFPLVRSGNVTFDHKFTAVFDDWDVLTQDCTKGESLICKQLYHSTVINSTPA